MPQDSSDGLSLFNANGVPVANVRLIPFQRQGAIAGENRPLPVNSRRFGRRECGGEEKMNPKSYNLYKFDVQMFAGPMQ